jgi:hypothetical protein
MAVEEHILMWVLFINSPKTKTNEKSSIPWMVKELFTRT